MNMKKYILVFVAIFFLGITPVFATYGIQTKTSHCVADVLPDPACSPGSVLTTDIKTICTVGYTKTVRDVSTATKKKVFQEYNIPWSTHSNYEVDHIISLELGGSNDISNLFPESYLIKNGARVKDVLENYLHKQVCNGSMTIAEAQIEISSDWLTYYTAMLNPVKTPVVKPSSVTSTKTTIPVPQITTPSVFTPVIPITQSQVISPKIPATSATEPAVKKSSTGLCHAIGTTYYSRTTNYTAYSSIADCLASGGKLPKN